MGTLALDFSALQPTMERFVRSEKLKETNFFKFSIGSISLLLLRECLMSHDFLTTLLSN